MAYTLLLRCKNHKSLGWAKQCPSWRVQAPVNIRPVLPGTHTRAGCCLIPCRRRYDVAISTACTALDYIVVESTSDAQRCVELLRRQHLGVATCLILEKQKHLAAAMNERVSTPEGAE